MSLSGEQILLRVYLQSADRAPLTPTYELLVKAARREGLAGATVLRGILGFGSRGIVRALPAALVEHVPVIVEIVDRPEKIIAFLGGTVEEHMVRGLATLERASVMLYRQRKQESPVGLQLGQLLHPLSTIPELPPGGRMTINKNGVLLRIFIGESDRFEHQPLHEAIVQKARELGLAGATVLRGVEGFGANSVVHKSKLLDMSTDLPIVIEIVEAEEKVKFLLPHLETMVREGMITMEYVVILKYSSRQPAGAKNG